MGNADSIPGDRLAIDVDFQIRLSNDTVGYNRRGLHARDLLEKSFYFQTDFLNRIQVGSFYLDAHRGAHAALQHDYPGGDRL